MAWDDLSGDSQKPAGAGALRGLRYTTSQSPDGQQENVIGEDFVGARSGQGVQITTCSSWDAADAMPAFWAGFAATGHLGAAGAATPQKPAGAVAAAVTLGPGQSRTLRFYVAWAMPHLVTVQKRLVMGPGQDKSLEGVAALFDSNPATRWSTARPMQAGDNLVLDLGQTVTPTQVTLDSGAAGTDGPRGLRVEVSGDGNVVACVASGHIAMAPVDVCKTPAPPLPPIPIPYPNIAMSATMGPGYTTKTMATFTPIWTKSGKSALSNGDQAGVAGGIMSGMIMGMCSLLMASFDVLAEGAGVGRTLDMSDSNKQNKGVGTLILAGAAAVPMSPQSAACKALSAAVEAWCGTKPGDKKGTFNDYFFEALKKDKPVGAALAAAIEGDKQVTPAKASVSIAAKAARASGASGAAGRRTMLTSPSAEGASGITSAAAWGKLSAGWLKEPAASPAPQMPTAKIKNDAIAIKAPGDTFSPGKLAEWQLLQRDRKVVEVSGESCGEETAKGNKCS